MSSFYIGTIIGFILGTFAGIILAALMVAAGRESNRVMTAAEEEPPAPPKTHWIAYERGRYACRDFPGLNPYPEHSVPWHSWNKGWDDELDGVKPE